jgi:uncharacterized membrane protein
MLLVALTSCNSADAGTTPLPPTPSLTLSLSAPSVTVRAGDQGLLQVLLTRANLSQDVRLTVSDLPSGMTGAFTPATLPLGSVASTLLLNAARTTIPGNYTAIITASAQGINAQALPLSITIRPAPAIALTAKPESLSVIAGASGSVTIDIERTDYAGRVYFESEGAPPGVSTSFPDSPTTGSLATVTVSVTSDVLPGVYVFAIDGFAEGIPAVNTFIQLTVLPPLVIGFDVRVSPGVVMLKQGMPDSTKVTIDRQGYDGEVTLSAAGLPDGVVATFSPKATTGTSAIVTFFGGATTPPGTYPLAIIASGPNAVTTSANLDLVVIETPALALEGLPDSLTVTAGDTIHGSLNLVRTNLPGEVQLSATGLPAGVTLTFAGNPSTESSVALVFVVDANTAPGTYVVAIHATAAGIDRVDVMLTLTVQARP